MLVYHPLIMHAPMADNPLTVRLKVLSAPKVCLASLEGAARLGEVVHLSHERLELAAGVAGGQHLLREVVLRLDDCMQQTHAEACSHMSFANCAELTRAWLSSVMQNLSLYAMHLSLTA